MKATSIFVGLLLIAFSCKKKEQIFSESLIQIGQQSVYYPVSYSTTGSDTIFLPFVAIGTPSSSDRKIALLFDSASQSYFDRGIIAMNADLVFPAEAYHTAHPIVIMADSLADQITIRFSLEMDADASTAQNYKTANISIYKQSLTDLFSGNFYCFESAYSNKYIVQIGRNDAVSDTLRIKNFWDFTAADTEIKILVKRDESKSIELTEQYFTDIEGHEYIASGYGKYDINGSFYIDYILRKTSNNDIFEEGRQTYTPIK